MSTLREPEAQALYRAGLARPVGKRSRVRCLMLINHVPRGAASRLLQGKRGWSPSKSVRVERVGPKRQPVYQHLDRSFGFGGTDSLPIASRPAPELFRTVRITPNETPDALCTTVHTEPDQALQVIPDERGSDEGKEPERVPVEPETPDVAAPAKQPHNTTVPVDPSDMSRHRRLAVAVILRTALPSGSFLRTGDRVLIFVQCGGVRSGASGEESFSRTPR